MKRLLLLILPLMLLFLGCTPRVVVTSELNRESAFTEVPKGQWALVGMYSVDGYVSGMTITQPVYLVNRVVSVTEQKEVTTEPGEKAAGIPIKHPLAFNNISKVFSIESDLPGEILRVTDYNQTNWLLWVEGFKPDSKRILLITYAPVLTFNTKITIDRVPKTEGFVAAPPEILPWINIDEMTFNLSPEEADVLHISVALPKGTEAPKRWMFWIETGLASDYSPSVVVTKPGTTEIVSVLGETASIKTVMATQTPFKVVMR